jgi:hypothetical protein
MAGVAEQLGIAADQAQEAASYALVFTSMPARYQSDECRDGGELDRNQGSPPWP